MYRQEYDVSCIDKNKDEKVIDRTWCQTTGLLNLENKWRQKAYIQQTKRKDASILWTWMDEPERTMA